MRLDVRVALIATFLATHVESLRTITGVGASSQIVSEAQRLPLVVARCATHQLLGHRCPFQLFDPGCVLLRLVGLLLLYRVLSLKLTRGSLDAYYVLAT